MNGELKVFISVAIVTATLLGVFALPAVSAETAARSETSLQTPRRFHLTSVLQASTSLHELDSADHVSDAELLLQAVYQLDDSLKLGIRTGVKQNLENERETRLSDTRLGLSLNALRLNPFLSLVPQTAVTFATQKESLQRDSLRAAAHLQARLNVDLSRLGLRPLGFSWFTSLTRNFHQYRTNRPGAANTALSLLNTLEATWSFSDRLSVSTSFSRGIGWTYQGSRKNNFEVAEAVTWSPAEALSLSLGHSNSGAAYKENGRDSNLAVFNPNDSALFGSLTLVY